MQMVAASTNPVTEMELLDHECRVKQVESIGGLRNNYAHGRWLPSSGASSDDPEMTFIPLQWASGNNEPRPTVTIRQLALEKQAQMIPALAGHMRKVLVPFLEYRPHQQDRMTSHDSRMLAAHTAISSAFMPPSIALTNHPGRFP